MNIGRWILANAVSVGLTAAAAALLGYHYDWRLGCFIAVVLVANNIARAIGER